MTHSSSLPEWQNNTINTPSPIFFPSSSPTPKLSSTPTKKPPSPVDWHEELARDESNSAARQTARARRNNDLHHHHHHHASFTFDGDLTRPDLDLLLEKLQQSTLSTDTLTSSFLGDLDDDIPADDLFAVLSLAAAATATEGKLAKSQPLPPPPPRLQNTTSNSSSSNSNNNNDNTLELESDSQQLRQWLEQLPDFSIEAATAASSSSLETTAGETNSQEQKRASLVKFGKQWVTRMKKAASNGANLTSTK